MAAGNSKVLIVGGGIGGLVTALALRLRGIDFLLLEQADAFRAVGAGIQLSPNATRVLRALGLGDALARVAVYPRGLDVRSWDSGEQLLWTPLGQQAEAHFGAPYYHIHRADLLDVLVAAVGNSLIRLRTPVRTFGQDSNAVTVTLADGEVITGDLLIGADGIHSTVRAQLFGSDQPRFSGSVAWRGLVSAERLAHLPLDRVTGAWWGPNRSMVHYFVSEGRTLNWIGISRSSGASRESWLAEGRVDEVMDEYRGWHPTIRAIIEATPRVLKQALYDREPLTAWTRGRVALLGDAAHAMMPFHAQGAAQSIEDAYILAACLDQQRSKPVAALERYVELRQPRAAWAQQFSRDAEELNHMADPVRVARRNARLRENQGTYPAGFPPGQERLYGYDGVNAVGAATR